MKTAARLRGKPVFDFNRPGLYPSGELQQQVDLCIGTGPVKSGLGAFRGKREKIFDDKPFLA